MPEHTFKLPKPKSSRDAERFLNLGKDLSKQAPTNMFSKGSARDQGKLPGGKKAPKRR